MILFDKSEVDFDLIIVESEKLKYHVDAGYINMAITQSGGLPSDILSMPGIASTIKEIATNRRLDPINVMVNWLAPGAPVPKHRDWIKPTPLQKHKPCIERWHLAVETNDKCFWWDQINGRIHFPQGFWCGPVPYWMYHTAINDGKTKRLHIVVDLDTSERMGKYAEDFGGLGIDTSSSRAAETR